MIKINKKNLSNAIKKLLLVDRASNWAIFVKELVILFCIAICLIFIHYLSIYFDLSNLYITFVLKIFVYAAALFAICTVKYVIREFVRLFHDVPPPKKTRKAKESKIILTKLEQAWHK